MPLLDPPRHTAADLLDLISDVVAAVAIAGVSACSRTTGGTHRARRLQLTPMPGPARGGALAGLPGPSARHGSPTIAVDSTVGPGAGHPNPRTGGEGLDRSLGQAADTVAGLVLSGAELAAHVVVAVIGPVESMTQTAAKGELGGHAGTDNSERGSSRGLGPPTPAARGWGRRHLEPVAHQAPIHPGRQVGLRVARESGG